MRPLLMIFYLATCSLAYAIRPEYVSSRTFVERECATNSTPQEERIFVVGCCEKAKVFAEILHFRQGITLREIIDQTSLKGKGVHVMILRPEVRTSHDFIRVGRSETPRCKIQALDVIWLYDFKPEDIDL
jgi:hypothetical protein